MHEVSSCGKASALLEEREFPVVLCEHRQTDGNWKDLLDVTVTLPAPPSLVVFSPLADESLWAEVLNLGGFDVVAMPFEPEEVLRVAFAAWRKWCEVSRNSPQEKQRLKGRKNLPEQAVRRRARGWTPKGAHPQCWGRRRELVAEMVETSPAMAKGNMGTQDKRAPGAVSRTPIARPLGQTDGFDETAVVDRARNGDFRAFSELVERNGASVFQLTRHLTRNQEDAEEVLQGTFLEAYENLGELRGNSGFRPWLVRIAVRRALMRPGARRKGPGCLAGRAFEAEEKAATREARDSRTAHLESLRPVLRAVFLLRDMEGIRTEDTAAVCTVAGAGGPAPAAAGSHAIAGQAEPILQQRIIREAGQTQSCPTVLS